MKSQSQALMIALAISFAVALALTVASICISYVKEDPHPVDGGEEYPSDTEGVLLPPAESATQLREWESESDTAEPPTVILPDPGSGLKFVSNGDGTCTLAGIGNCLDSSVVIPAYSSDGEAVTEIAPMAFYACATVTAIQIPASVRQIGALAFAACPNLAYISVSSANPFYCDVDGVLYGAGATVLIQYPPMRVGSCAVISSVTTEILDMAFYGCMYLSRVSYTGSAEQWESIRIGAKNYSLIAASKTFATGQ